MKFSKERVIDIEETEESDEDDGEDGGATFE